MLSEVAGLTFPMSPHLLESVLIHHRKQQAHQEYALHLLWLIGLQLFSLAGGSCYPIPSPTEVFSPVQEESDNANDIRLRILQRLHGERSDA